MACFRFIHKISFLAARKVGATNKEEYQTNMSPLQIVTLSLLLACHTAIACLPLSRIDAALPKSSESERRLETLVEEDDKTYVPKMQRLEHPNLLSPLLVLTYDCVSLDIAVFSSSSRKHWICRILIVFPCPSQ